MLHPHAPNGGTVVEDAEGHYPLPLARALPLSPISTIPCKSIEVPHIRKRWVLLCRWLDIGDGALPRTLPASVWNPNPNLPKTEGFCGQTP